MYAQRLWARNGSQKEDRRNEDRSAVRRDVGVCRVAEVGAAPADDHAVGAGQGLRAVAVVRVLPAHVALAHRLRVGLHWREKTRRKSLIIINNYWSTDNLVNTVIWATVAQWAHDYFIYFDIEQTVNEWANSSSTLYHWKRRCHARPSVSHTHSKVLLPNLKILLPERIFFIQSE